MTKYATGMTLDQTAEALVHDAMVRPGHLMDLPPLDQVRAATPKASAISNRIRQLKDAMFHDSQEGKPANAGDAQIREYASLRIEQAVNKTIDAVASELGFGERGTETLRSKVRTDMNARGADAHKEHIATHVQQTSEEILSRMLQAVKAVVDADEIKMDELDAILRATQTMVYIRQALRAETVEK